MTAPTGPARIVFAGTPGFAVPCLRALVDSEHSVGLVLTQPDRPAGRGRKLKASPVKELALESDIEVLQPERLDPAVHDNLLSRPADLLVVVAYGLILPDWMLAWPAVAAVNVHASLLPRWRGASPIQQAILAGDAESGVSVMQMTRGLDCGPVYASRAIPIAVGETAGELHDRLAVLGADALRASLDGIIAGSLVATPQEEAASSYAPKITKHEATIDWRRSAAELQSKVLAFNPWPVAETCTGTGERLRIWRAMALGSTADGEPGAVVNAGGEGIDVATGDGVLRLLEVQAAGGRSMSSSDYLKGHNIDGQQLGRR